MLKTRSRQLARVAFFSIFYLVVAYLVPLQQGAPTLGYMLGALITGLLYGTILLYLESRLQASRVKRILIIAFPIYAIQFLNPVLEGYFFTTRLNSPATLLGAIIFGFILALTYSTAASLIFPSEASLAELNEDHKKLNFREFPNLLKMIFAALSWPLIYFVFGLIISPLVSPYYNDPQSPYYLVLPGLGTILMVQVLRGFIYVVSLIPLLSNLRFNARSMLLILTGLMYIGGGLAIFVIVETFPLTLRIIHGVEIFADSLVFSAVVTYLLNMRHPPLTMSHLYSLGASLYSILCFSL